MRTGLVVSGVFAVLAAVGLTTVFVNNASPYLTIKELKDAGGDVHVVGKIVPNTLVQNSLAREVKFTIQDETGQLPVVYTGPPQSNLASATQVVVIGAKKGESFQARQMLVKCPSKYESEKKS